MQTTKEVQVGGTWATLVGLGDDPYFKDVTSHVQEMSSLYTVAAACCSHDAVMLDVGANIGVSAVVLSHINPNGRIICVEPSPRNVDLLRTNLDRNVKQNTTIVQAALGAEIGHVEFHESLVCGAWNHVASDRKLGGPVDGTVRVPLLTVDEIVAQNRLDRVDFIKIDVEGFETEVLKGMKGTVERFNPVVHIEINSVTSIIVSDVSPRRLLEQFEGLMGSVFSKEDGQLVPIDTIKARTLFVFKNLIEHGCVDDVVGCRDPQKLKSLIAGQSGGV